MRYSISMIWREKKTKTSSKADLSVVQLCFYARSNCGKVFCPACPGGPETPVVTEHTVSLNMNLELRWALSRWIILWGKNGKSPPVIITMLERGSS